MGHVFSFSHLLYVLSSVSCALCPKLRTPVPSVRDPHERSEYQKINRRISDFCFKFVGYGSIGAPGITKLQNTRRY